MKETSKRTAEGEKRGEKGIHLFFMIIERVQNQAEEVDMNIDFLK